MHPVTQSSKRSGAPSLRDEPYVLTLIQRSLTHQIRYLPQRRERFKERTTSTLCNLVYCLTATVSSLISKCLEGGFRKDDGWTADNNGRSYELVFLTCKRIQFWQEKEKHELALGKFLVFVIKIVYGEFREGDIIYT